MEATREEMAAQAVILMEKLGINQSVIREFRENGRLFYSKGAKFYLLNDQLKKDVSDFEERTGGVVFHAGQIGGRRSPIRLLLYVPKDKSQWEEQMEETEYGFPYAYWLEPRLDYKGYSQKATVIVRDGSIRWL